MNWGMMLVTQSVIAVAVVAMIGWSFYAIVRALITQYRGNRYKR